MSDLNRIKELVYKLNEASKYYYQKDMEIMSNYEYDRLYDELLELEDRYNIVLANSPTKKVGYEILSSLPKEKHTFPMLSLDKTKNIEDLKSWLKNELGLLSWKLDGLTVVLTYSNGELVKAVTRGTGEIGEVITNNAKVFKNVPIRIPFRNDLVIRGEAVIKYSDFYRINEELEIDEQYKNPRNLCSGTVRQLNNEVTAKRSVNFFVFQVVHAEGIDFQDSKLNALEFAESLGFEISETKIVKQDTIEKVVNEFNEKIEKNDFASDGLVLTYDSISYSNSLGSTSKFPRHSIAYKWKDEKKETKLLDIEWSASRTGLINPIAIFEPVELEGTTVARASLHNLSILEELELGIGDTVTVYKANMIIPQIADNVTRTNNIEYPTKCPVCSEEVTIEEKNKVKAIYCNNNNCGAKKIKSLAHFVSRDAMNIEGLSEATLEKFINKGFIHDFTDIYRIGDYKDEIVNMDGFGEKSYENLINSIDKSKTTTIPNFIYSLGIKNVGLSNAKLLNKHFNNNLEKILKAKIEELIEVDGFGEMIGKNIVDYFNDENKLKTIKELIEIFTFEIEEKGKETLRNMTFVITGSLEKFNNRNEIEDFIEKLGGKTAKSVTSKTSYLINNDVSSNSSKNKKAKDLNIPIVSEEEFMEIVKGMS